MSSLPCYFGSVIQLIFFFFYQVDLRPTQLNRGNCQWSTGDGRVLICGMVVKWMVSKASPHIITRLFLPEVGFVRDENVSFG